MAAGADAHRILHGRLADGDVLIERAKAKASGSDALRARILHADVDAARFTNDYARQRGAAWGLIESRRAVGDRTGAAYGHLFYAIACINMCEPDVGRGHFEAAAELYEALGATRWHVIVLQGLTALELLYGSQDEALAVALRCETMARTLGYGFGVGIAASNVSALLSLRGSFVEAKSAAERAVAEASRISTDYVLGTALCALGLAERGLGELTSALDHFERGVEIECRVPVLDPLGDDLSELMTTYAIAGKLERIRPLIERALRIHSDYTAQLPRAQSLLWAAAQGFRALGEEAKSRHYLDAAHVELQSQMARIGNEAARAAYGRFWTNARILDAVERDEWPWQRRVPAAPPPAAAATPPAAALT